MDNKKIDFKDEVVNKLPGLEELKKMLTDINKESKKHNSTILVNDDYLEKIDQDKFDID